MNRKEAVALTRIVAATCPQQVMDDYTPDAWYEVLSDLESADCMRAVRVIKQRQPFVDPSEIRAEVRRVRNDRIARSLIPAPPPELTDDPRAYKAALAESLRRAADGELPEAIAGGPAPLAITGPRRNGPPAALAASLTELRARLGTARAARQDPAA